MWMLIRDLVGQGFALSLILSALYIALIFYILEKKNQKFSNSYSDFFHVFC